MIISGGELARRAGVSKQIVSKKANSGELPRAAFPDGKPGFDDTHPDIIAYIDRDTRQRRTAGRARATTEPPQQPKAQAPAVVEHEQQPPQGSNSGRGRRSGGYGGSKEGPAKSDYLSRKEKALAEKHELANRILRHKYVPIEDASSVFGQVCAVHTGVICPLGARIGSLIAAELKITDPVLVLKIQEIIDGETYPAVTEIKRLLNDFLIKAGERVISESEELAISSEESDE